jgi:hypothetical protein
MYSTCLYCNRDLGRNEVLDDFPVGRRIAFDPAKGRLWVVCRACERWSLSPLEERWEAVEQAERCYHETRRRVSSDQIGLARLADGTELVRIGAPLRPEFAAWRYGDQFGRRRRRQLILAGAGLAAIGVGIVGGAVAGASIAAFGGGIGQLAQNIVHGRDDKVVARLTTESQGTISVRRRHLAETRIVPGTDAPIALQLRFKNGEALFEGREALRLAGALLPHINRFGGKRQVVGSAVAVLEESGGPEGYFERLARVAPAATRVPVKRSGKRKPKKGSFGGFTSGLFGLTRTDRLALEMALHEEAEMRALQGELAELERAWREAEEIAAIADDLLVPSAIRGALDRLRGA